jgi:SPP1 family predicted phage head-tail adaptor
MRHRLVLERLQQTADGGGGVSESWVEEAVVWAAIRPLDGAEGVAADRVVGRLSHEVTTRYRPGVVPAMRFRFGTRVLQIAAVIDEGERRAWLRCLCSEEEL